MTEPARAPHLARREAEALAATPRCSSKARARAWKTNTACLVSCLLLLLLLCDRCGEGAFTAYVLYASRTLARCGLAEIEEVSREEIIVPREQAREGGGARTIR